MRSAVFVCILVVLGCLFFEAEAQCLGYRGEDFTVGVHHRNCTEIRCLEDGSIRQNACGLYSCPEGKEIGFKETDLSKPWPDCCSGPVCA